MLKFFWFYFLFLMFTMLFLKKIYIQLFNQNLNVIHERDTELTILCDVNNACAMFLFTYRMLIRNCHMWQTLKTVYLYSKWTSKQKNICLEQNLYQFIRPNVNMAHTCILRHYAHSTQVINNRLDRWLQGSWLACVCVWWLCTCLLIWIQYVISYNLIFLDTMLNVHLFFRLFFWCYIKWEWLIKSGVFMKWNVYGDF